MTLKNKAANTNRSSDLARPSISSISGGLATLLLEDRIRDGKTIEIPSLHIQMRAGRKSGRSLGRAKRIHVKGGTAKG